MFISYKGKKSNNAMEKPDNTLIIYQSVSFSVVSNSLWHYEL